MNNELELISEWELKKEESISAACRMLEGQEDIYQDDIASFVASICQVAVPDMMTRTDKLHFNHARWLFWYAYRYATYEPFIKIADVTSRWGRRFTEQGISSSVNKMGRLISANTMWTKRWLLVKRLINAQNKKHEDDNTIVILVPRGMRDSIKVEIKEK